MTAASPPPLNPGAPGLDPAPAADFGAKWATLLQAAGVVAALAGRPDDPIRAEVRDFPQAMAAAGGWRLALAAQGVDDLAAVMEPGLTALLAIHGRGADPAVAAEALWEEFAAACGALLALLPPPPA
jgi:hypothetical protein